MSMRSEEEVEVGSQSGTLTGRGASPRAHYRVWPESRAARYQHRAAARPRACLSASSLRRPLPTPRTSFRTRLVNRALLLAP
jgi:hypothetical protein